MPRKLISTVNKMKMMKILGVLIIALFISGCTILNESDMWLKKQEISKGLKPVPSYQTNKAEFEKQYALNKSNWDKAFEFMKTQDLENLAVGKHPINGEEVFASVTEIVDKPLEETKWESHKKYIDLQYVIRGKEKMGIAPSLNAKVTNSYNLTKDVANYEIEKGYFEIATPKHFYLFFPSDAHRPNIKVDEEKVKKLVIKIRVAN